MGQCLPTSLWTLSDQGGIEIADRTAGNQTLDEPRCMVRGTSEHISFSAPCSQGRRPPHLTTPPNALAPKLPAIVLGCTPQLHDSTMSLSDELSPNVLSRILWAAPSATSWFT